MNPPKSRSVVIEREIPHPLEKVWRALTRGALIEDWLMANDFQPIVGHKFQLRAPPTARWNGLADCEVIAVEPPRSLSYSWNSAGDEAANGLRTLVTWTLTPTPRGVLLRLEHAGFQAHEEANFRGASFGWPRYLDRLERVVAGLADASAPPE